MREIVLDTETTGLSPQDGHRIIEIGAIELYNHLPTGNSLHIYINPQRDVPAEAVAIHGLTNEFLADKPIFTDIIKEFIAFIGDAKLIIHNANFDMSFINAELGRAKCDSLSMDRVVDTLTLARKKHPMGPNSLDALCKRYNIDNSKREKHGALLDSELLAAVYIELIEARQPGLHLEVKKEKTIKAEFFDAQKTRIRPEPLRPRLTDLEKTRHIEQINQIGSQNLWSK